MTEEQAVASLAWATNEITALRAKVASFEGAQSASNSLATNGEVSEPFQQRVGQWMDACFTPAVKADKLERCDRFIEEALELAQTNAAFTIDRAHALVDYVFARPVGETGQEVGGVMVTLAALCGPFGVDMNEEAEREMVRITQPAMIEKIRAKQADKPTGSSLPIANLTPRAASGDERRMVQCQLHRGGAAWILYVNESDLSSLAMEAARIPAAPDDVERLLRM